VTALAGLRVVDLTEGVSGPYCTKLLAGLGAEVIKVEPPGGESGRHAGPFADLTPRPPSLAGKGEDAATAGERSSPFPRREGGREVRFLSLRFLHLNTGKLGITLNVESATGRRLLDRLLADADVLVVDGPPLRLSERRLDQATLERDYPKLIVTAISPFGRSGPYRDFTASEIVLYAVGGYLVLTGDPNKPPIKAYGSQVEYQAGLQAAVGTLVALRARDTRPGQPASLVDVAAYEAATFLLGGPAQVYAVTGDVYRRNGTRLIGHGPYHPYPSTLRPCLGGYVHAHSNNRHWDLISILMEDERLASPEFLEAPSGHADEIDALMDAWLADKDKFEAVRRAQELRVPFTEVMTPAEVLAEPHYTERGFWATIDHPEAGTLRQPGPPIRMARTPWQTHRAPLLGEHNAAVYCDRLGLPRTALARLRAAGIL
jgi:crotonobetainyl-CoA:carnitine CoA-transferase CaiB-like acyl-CoA transferase